MSYPEPYSSISNLEFLEEDKEKSLLKDSSGLNYNIELINQNIWSIELRYDQIVKAIRRQPFTGNQENLENATLQHSKKADSHVFRCNDQSCEISQKTGSFKLFSNNTCFFSATENPFSLHKTETSIYEGIESKDITDFSTRAPFAPQGKQFDTHMIRFQYPRTAKTVLGLPGQCGEFNRDGYRFELYNTDQPSHNPSRPPMYQSWPILFQKAIDDSGWVAIFHDNPSRTFVDIGVLYEDLCTFESVTGNTRIYITHGKTLRDVSKNLSTLLGAPALPPRWAFGYQQCRWSYMDTNKVRSVINRLDEEDFPVDAIYFDIDYMDQFKVFTKNSKTFGDLKECINDLHKNDIHSVCIIDPGVKVDEQYETFSKIQKEGFALQNEDKTHYEGIVWPGDVIFPDFSHKNTSNIWSDTQAQWISDYPFDGVWNDMNEPSNFRGANEETSKTHTHTGPLRDEYNLYGYHMAKTSHGGMLKAEKQNRPFVITRAGYPGVQKYSVIWHGDNSSWWEHLRLMIDTCVSYSLCGAYYTGADVPGFFNNAPDDLALRFFQAGAFLPLFRGHSWYFAKDKEPYAFNASTKEGIRNVIKLRYSLLREWYSYFELHTRNQTPPIEPVLTKNNDTVRDQFILFDKFLVAPVIERNQQMKLIYLPEGHWYRFENTKDIIAGNTWITESIHDDSIPLFVKAGSIVTRNTPMNRTEKTLNAKELFEIYPKEDGTAHGYWYDDDGKSYSSKKTRYELRTDSNTNKVEKYQA